MDWVGLGQKRHLSGGLGWVQISRKMTDCAVFGAPLTILSVFFVTKLIYRAY